MKDAELLEKMDEMKLDDTEKKTSDKPEEQIKLNGDWLSMKMDDATFLNDTLHV